MIDYAVNVFKEEASAILNLINYLDDSFELAIKAILNSKGRVIITGIGKSGIIGKKISTTLASTGTPSFFLHPSDAYHGDLGMITREDIVIAITNSGETDEVLKLVPFIRDNKNLLIAITGNPESTLAKNSDLHLNIHVDQEVCPLNLTPTSSSTTTLVMGDALVVALIRERDFKPKDYARFHPGGNLGKRLLLKVRDIMISSNLPICYKNTKVLDLFYIISKGQLGLTIVINDNNKIEGLISDGDLRRGIQKFGRDIFDKNAEQIMNSKPVVVNADELAANAEKTMIENKLKTIIVVDNSRSLLGVYNLTQSLTL